MGFTINTPPVIHQTLDGEVIVVNLDSGTYYSIAGSGAAVWGAIESGATVESAAEAVLRRYEGTPAAVEEAVRRFVDELVAEELLTPGENGAAAPPAEKADEPAGAREPFVEPRLERYTDMQELLMIDPIHEVDERGWPSVAGEAPAPDSGGV